MLRLHTLYEIINNIKTNIKNKKSKIEISKTTCKNGVFKITISNVGLYKEKISKIRDVFKEFANDDEIFFGSYRVDGFCLTNEESGYYSKLIPDYFTKNGQMSEHQQLFMYSAPNTPDTHVIAEKVFLYHLETTAFCPKVSWETFVDSYKLYMKHGTRNYVDIGFADFIFSYVDSTDFSVIFNSKIYDCEYVYKTLKHIFDIEY